MLFDNINISGKRLEGEDFKTYKIRRKIVNQITNPKSLINSQDILIVGKKGFKQTVPGKTEKDIKAIFSEQGIKILT